MKGIKWLRKGPHDLGPENIGVVVGLEMESVGTVHWGILDLVQVSLGEESEYKTAYKLRGRDDWNYSPDDPSYAVTGVLVQELLEEL